MAEKMEMTNMLLFMVIAIVALVAIVAVAAMVFHDTVSDGAAFEGAVSARSLERAVGFQRPLGSFCVTDDQCESGQCDGLVFLSNGKTVPGIRACT